MKEKFLETATTPLAQKIGNTLSSLWTIVFGGIDIYADKRDYARHHTLQEFKDELDSKLNAIPQENLIEPPLHILGPTLESARFYFEEEKLRSMFTELIVASANIDTIHMTHPSFVEIIKQLSPLDAENLNIIKHQQTHPIANYIASSFDSGYHTLAQNIFLANKNISDFKLISQSITNLARLGIVTISYTNVLSDPHQYDPFFETEHFEKYQYINESIQNNSIDLPDSINEDIIELIGNRKIDIQPGLLSITPFGEDFIKICLP